MNSSDFSMNYSPQCIPYLKELFIMTMNIIHHSINHTWLLKILPSVAHYSRSVVTQIYMPEIC